MIKVFLNPFVKHYSFNEWVKRFVPLGNFCLFFLNFLKVLFKEGVNNKFVLYQIEHLGINSIAICTITGGFPVQLWPCKAIKDSSSLGGII